MGLSSASPPATLRSALWARAWPLGVALAVLLAAANLLAGLSGGLARLGWPVPTAALAAHGVVLLFGFFGALIALERAVALRTLAGLGGLTVAVAAGLGAVMVWAGPWPFWGWMLNGAAALGLVALYVLAARRRADSLHLRVEAGAAGAWALGVLAVLAQAPAAATLAGMAFLVGTIVGERRELTQFARLPRRAERSFVLGVAAAAVGLLAAVLPPVVGAAWPAASALGAQAAAAARWGEALWWLALAGLTVWLVRRDIGLQPWRRPGWVGHTARCLAVGYGWLMVAAVLSLAGVGAQAMGVPAPAWSHGATHALLLGFVFAMVFGHAPLMLPALARLKPRYTPWAGLPLGLLALSIALRLAATGTGSGVALAWAGAGHALALALFALVMARATWQGWRGGRASTARGR